MRDEGKTGRFHPSSLIPFSRSEPAEGAGAVAEARDFDAHAVQQGNVKVAKRCVAGMGQVSAGLKAPRCPCRPGGPGRLFGLWLLPSEKLEPNRIIELSRSVRSPSLRMDCKALEQVSELGHVPARDDLVLLDLGRLVGVVRGFVMAFADAVQE